VLHVDGTISLVKDGKYYPIPAFGPLTAITICENFILGVCSDFSLLQISLTDLKLSRVEGKINCTSKTYPIFSLSRKKGNQIFGFSSNIQFIVTLNEGNALNLKGNKATVSCNEQGVLGFDYLESNELILIQKQGESHLKLKKL